MVYRVQQDAPASSIGLNALQTQLREITRQLEGTARFRENLLGQLRSANNPGEAAQLNMRIAESDNVASSLQARFSEVVGKIAEIEAQRTIGEMSLPPGFPGGAGFPGFPAQRGPWGIDPDAFTAAFMILVVGIVVPASIALSRRLWRRPQPVVAPSRDADSGNRLERLEQAVDTIAIEIERISESQRFVAKVLTERPASARAAIVPEAGAVGEAAPLRALGAGPIEPIQVAQRQGVKQSITPH